MLDFIKANIFVLTIVFIVVYFIVNFFDGNRGYWAYHEKLKLIVDLEKKQQLLQKELNKIKKENEMLSTKINLDYLDEIYRSLFMVGLKNEKVYIIKKAK